ncbi:sugar phosphate isomerase/epimerase family protein [Limnochorda pilosa]|uniref:Xylose isomerase n=1 Tax=Limnochorda pilosa TaxID=1555112 RepID=A0A0K2SGC9_LIMPI|nr:TIM barrel protein [Limnochorda pilosa]BAS26107.1 xylose isomerase [Limnochorda pilosa]
MREPIEAYMRVGIVHFMAFPAAEAEGTVAETVRRIAEDDFFEAIEITRVKDPAERERVARILDQAQMAVGFGAQPIELGGKLDLNAAGEAARRRAVEELKAAIDEADAMGIHRVALLSGRDPGEAERAAATDRLAVSLEELCAHAAPKGTTVILETFDRTVDKRALMGPSGEAAALAKRIRARYDNFGLMLDLSHLPLQDEEPAGALGNARDHLVHAHVGNCVKDPSHPLYGDQHPRFGIAGGEVEVPQLADFLRVLLQIGYLGPNPKERPVVAFEVKPQPGESSELVIANAKRTLREAWARV